MDETTVLAYQKRAEAVVAGEHLMDEIMGLHGAIMQLMEELKQRPSDDVGLTLQPCCQSCVRAYYC